MKKKILTGLGALIFLTALIFNVSIAKDNNNLVLNKMGSIAVAYDEDISEGSGNSGGTTPKCVQLGNNYPGMQSSESHFYCSASGKNETTVSCGGSGGGCQEVVKK
jgi:hypothetical protein